MGALGEPLRADYGPLAKLETLATKLMREAIEALRQLPAEQQDEIAGAVLRLTGRESGVYLLTPEEQADLDAADDEIARSEFATDDEIKAIWAKHGL